MLDALSSNLLLIGAMICLVLIVALTLYKPKPKDKKEKIDKKEKELKELDIAEKTIAKEEPETLDFKEETYEESKKEEPIIQEEVKPEEPEEVIKTEEPLHKEEVNPKYFEDDDTYVYEKVDFDKSEKKNDLDNIINQMAEDSKNPKTTDEFEDAQEKTAIISYQELQKAKEENRLHTYDDEDEENSLQEEVNQYKDELLTVDPVKKDDGEHHFKPSAIISPVSGRVDADLEYQKIPNFKKDKIEEKDTDNIIKEEDYSQDEEFLKSLIDFRNNLN